MTIRKMMLAGLLATTTASVCATPVVLNVVTDNYASETWFEMLDSSNTAVTFDSFTGPASTDLNDGFANQGDLTSDSSYSFTWNLAGGDYEFMIFDSIGDGICCGFGQGSYELIVDGLFVGSGGGGSGMLETFTVDATAVPESGMLALFGAGLIGFDLARRKS